MSYQHKKILIIEDDEALRNTLMPELSAIFTVLTAADGQEALTSIELNSPDLILLDLLIPKISGFDVLRKIREMENPLIANIPVIVVSNLNDPESMMKTQKYNIQAYLVKSEISVQKLITHIERILSHNS